MLRSFVILLIVLNVLLFGWGQGWMPWLGTLPGDAGRDLRRAERQQFPERLALVPDADTPRAPSLATSASAPVTTASSSATQVAAASTPVAASTAGSSPAASTPVASDPGGAAALADAGSPGVTPGQKDRPKDATTTPSVPVVAGPDIGLAAGARSSEPVCLELAYVSANESKDLEATLSRALKRADWNLQAATQPSTWIVYMGPYDAPDEADRKSAELRRMGLAFEEIRNPAALMPGFSLGRFSDAARAGDRLAEAQRKGVRTARVVEALPGRNVFMLRLPKADARVQTVLGELQQSQLKGRRFRPCVSPS